MSDGSESDPRDHSGGWLEDLRLALTALTRIAWAPRARLDAGRMAGAVRVFPIVGGGIGLAGGLAFAIALSLGLTSPLAAIVSVAAMLLLTGAMHETALGNLVDGFSGGDSPDRKLAVMRDSRMGSHAIMALTLALLARTGAVAAIYETGAVIAALIAAGAVSHAAVIWGLLSSPSAPPDNAEVSIARPTETAAFVAALIVLGIGILVLDIPTFIAGLTGAALGAGAIVVLAQRQIGGHSREVLGAMQQLAEVGFLFGVVAVTAA